MGKGSVIKEERGVLTFVIEFTEFVLCFFLNGFCV